MKNILFNAYIAYRIHIVNFTSVPKVDTPNSENHNPEPDPNILNLMVSHYDWAKQNNLRQFSLLNVELVNKHPQIYNTQKPKQQYMLEQKQKESKPSNVKHI